MSKQQRKLLIKQLTRETTLEILKQSNSVKKKELLSKGAKQLQSKLKDNKVTSDDNICMSYMGTTINELNKEKIIDVKEGIVTLTIDDSIKVTKEECKVVVLESLKKKSSTKDELFSIAIKGLGADKTKSSKDDEQIKSYVGTILSDLIKENALILKDKVYSLQTAQKYTKTPISEKEFKKQFFSRLHDNGGEFFERFLSNLLEKYYYESKRDVIENKIVGGADDGGIDIKLKIEDELGFIETIMVQAKCRLNTQTTEKEIREFAGAVYTSKGTRGMFVTTSTFHKNADKYLHSIDNCVGIDGDKLFEIAKSISYGMHQSKNGFKFDEMVFDI